jgi:hypothetical protein
MEEIFSKIEAGELIYLLTHDQLNQASFCVSMDMMCLCAG